MTRPGQDEDDGNAEDMPDKDETIGEESAACKKVENAPDQESEDQLRTGIGLDETEQETPDAPQSPLAALGSGDVTQGEPAVPEQPPRPPPTPPEPEPDEEPEGAGNGPRLEDAPTEAERVETDEELAATVE